MYDEYIQNIQALLREEPKKLSNFKSDPVYNYVLEHVSPEFGQQYLELIQTEFPEITQDMIAEFVGINDKYGAPTRHEFVFRNNHTLFASPSSLRYIYHAAAIMSWTSNPIRAVVEVGCGYGGLYLAICYLRHLWPRHSIQHYYLVDLPEIGKLIYRYLTLNSAHAGIPFSIHLPFGEEIPSDKEPLFFISNYCFTELDPAIREKYVATLFPKIQQGFLVWQTVFDCPLTLCYEYFSYYEYCEERPQTAGFEEGKKNYYVQFLLNNG